MSDVKNKGKSKKVKVFPETSVVEHPVVEVPVVVHPVVVHPVVEHPVVEVPVVHVVEQTVFEQPVVEEESNTEVLFNKLVNQFQDIQLVMKTLHLNLKVLQKEVLKERKDSKKKESKGRKKSDKKRSPSGFAKPSVISSSLATFFGLPEGSELARTEVTSKVIAYVKEHNLQNPENKKQILLDDKLKQLLSPKDTDVVTYFNLQTHLKQHFVSQTVTQDATVV